MKMTFKFAQTIFFKKNITRIHLTPPKKEKNIEDALDPYSHNSINCKIRRNNTKLKSEEIENTETNLRIKT